MGQVVVIHESEQPGAEYRDGAPCSVPAPDSVMRATIPSHIPPGHPSDAHSIGKPSRLALLPAFLWGCTSLQAQPCLCRCHVAPEPRCRRRSVSLRVAHLKLQLSSLFSRGGMQKQAQTPVNIFYILPPPFSNPCFHSYFPAGFFLGGGGKGFQSFP